MDDDADGPTPRGAEGEGGRELDLLDPSVWGVSSTDLELGLLAAATAASTSTPSAAKKAA